MANFFPRNVILISLDTLRHDCISAESNRLFLGELAPLVQTPNIDRLAAEGVRFSNCVSSCPLTTPSHAAMFTGMYWPKHRVFHQFETPMSARALPLAERLKKHKFFTLQNSGRALGEGAMFESKHTGLRRGYEKSVFAADLQHQTIKFITKQKAPWYLFFHTFNVHWPYGITPEAFDTQLASAWSSDDWTQVRRTYIENANRVDAQIGDLLAMLDQTGQREDTLIVLTADHGEGLNRRVPMHGAVNGGLDEVIRVPLIFHHPRSLKGNVTVDAPVRTIDIVPTILNLLGITEPYDPGFEMVDGRSLWPLMRGEVLAEKPACFCCFTYDFEADRPFLRGVRTREWKLILNDCTESEINRFAERIRTKMQWPLKDEVRLEGMRDILKRESFVELYDLRQDPFEQTNVAEANPEVVNHLVAELAQVDPGVRINQRSSSSLSKEELDILKQQLVDLGYMI
ncbi:MAG TPA: sulfatase [Acidobacteriota bacterium]|nr:sulfatase [Acidobacteriota bacterium]HMZ81238.1 sulfatase [Acidobacteriota bacterium]HNB71435.1 sulfatase [Acidobacteriota bacterium]HNC42611.1 sulfatase [Acidobacteriota bacterium]HNG94589.1 sulfatase [Acidobacteriota bacterium]